MREPGDAPDRATGSDGNAVDRAVGRLMKALESLDAAMERRVEHDRRREALYEQVHAFSDDRARLASELDAVAARSRSLETANREAMRRLDEAMDTIRTVIAAHQQAR